MARISGQNIVATFGDLDKANDAALALSRAGIEADRISLLGREQEEAASDPDTRLRDMEATGEVAKKAGTAGLAGGALGALAGAAAFLIPGVGPVIGSGIWAGVLAGGIAGGAVGGMVGGVGALSMEEFDLKYQHVLRDGKAMVAVAVEDDDAADDVRRHFEKEEPEDIHVIDGSASASASSHSPGLACRHDDPGGDMKFLVIWNIEIGRLSGEVMKAVLRMRDYAVPLEETGKVIGRYHIVGSHGGAWIYSVTSNDELEMLLAQSPVYNYSHFKVYPLADMTSLPVVPTA